MSVLLHVTAVIVIVLLGIQELSSQEYRQKYNNEDKDSFNQNSENIFKGRMIRKSQWSKESKDNGENEGKESIQQNSEDSLDPEDISTWDFKKLYQNFLTLLNTLTAEKDIYFNEYSRNGHEYETPAKQSERSKANEIEKTPSVTPNNINTDNIPNSKFKTHGKERNTGEYIDTQDIGGNNRRNHQTPDLDKQINENKNKTITSSANKNTENRSGHIKPQTSRNIIKQNSEGIDNSEEPRNPSGKENLQNSNSQKEGSINKSKDTPQGKNIAKPTNEASKHTSLLSGENKNQFQNSFIQPPSSSSVLNGTFTPKYAQNIPIHAVNNNDQNISGKTVASSRQSLNYHNSDGNNLKQYAESVDPTPETFTIPPRAINKANFNLKPNIYNPVLENEAVNPDFGMYSILPTSSENNPQRNEQINIPDITLKESEPAKIEQPERSQIITPSNINVLPDNYHIDNVNYLEPEFVQNKFLNVASLSPFVYSDPYVPNANDNNQQNIRNEQANILPIPSEGVIEPQTYKSPIGVLKDVEPDTGIPNSKYIFPGNYIFKESNNLEPNNVYNPLSEASLKLTNIHPDPEIFKIVENTPQDNGLNYFRISETPYKEESSLQMKDSNKEIPQKLEPQTGIDLIPYKEESPLQMSERTKGIPQQKQEPQTYISLTPYKEKRPPQIRDSNKEISQKEEPQTNIDLTPYKEENPAQLRDPAKEIPQKQEPKTNIDLRTIPSQVANNKKLNRKANGKEIIAKTPYKEEIPNFKNETLEMTPDETNSTGNDRKKMKENFSYQDDRFFQPQQSDSVETTELMNDMTTEASSDKNIPVHEIETSYPEEQTDVTTEAPNIQTSSLYQESVSNEPDYYNVSEKSNQESSSTEPYIDNGSTESDDDGSFKEPYNDSGSKEPYNKSGSNEPNKEHSSGKSYDKKNSEEIHDGLMPRKPYGENISETSREESDDKDLNEEKDANKSYEGDSSKSYEEDNSSVLYGEGGSDKSYMEGYSNESYEEGDSSESYEESDTENFYGGSNSDESRDEYDCGKNKNPSNEANDLKNTINNSTQDSGKSSPLSPNSACESSEDLSNEDTSSENRKHKNISSLKSESKSDKTDEPQETNTSKNDHKTTKSGNNPKISNSNRKSKSDKTEKSPKAPNLENENVSNENTNNPKSSYSKEENNNKDIETSQETLNSQNENITTENNSKESDSKEEDKNDDEEEDHQETLNSKNESPTNANTEDQKISNSEESKTDEIDESQEILRSKNGNPITENTKSPKMLNSKDESKGEKTETSLKTPNSKHGNTSIDNKKDPNILNSKNENKGDENEKPQKVLHSEDESETTETAENPKTSHSKEETNTDETENPQEVRSSEAKNEAIDTKSNHKTANSESENNSNEIEELQEAQSNSENGRASNKNPKKPELSHSKDGNKGDDIENSKETPNLKNGSQTFEKEMSPQTYSSKNGTHNVQRKKPNEELNFEDDNEQDDEKSPKVPESNSKIKIAENASPETFNSILEYLYKHSKNPFILSLKEERNKTHSNE